MSELPAANHRRVGIVGDPAATKRAGPSFAAKKGITGLHDLLRSSRPSLAAGREDDFCGANRLLHGVCVRLAVQRELFELRRRAMTVQVDGGLGALVDNECVPIDRHERRREHWPHQLPDAGS